MWSTKSERNASVPYDAFVLVCVTAHSCLPHTTEPQVIIWFVQLHCSLIISNLGEIMMLFPSLDILTKYSVVRQLAGDFSRSF